MRFETFLYSRARPLIALIYVLGTGFAIAARAA